MINFLIGFIAGFAASGVLSVLLVGVFIAEPERKLSEWMDRLRGRR